MSNEGKGRAKRSTHQREKDANAEFQCKMQRRLSENLGRGERVVEASSDYCLGSRSGRGTCDC